MVTALGGRLSMHGGDKTGHWSVCITQMRASLTNWANHWKMSASTVSEIARLVRI
jgi:hypothetical protein